MHRYLILVVAVINVFFYQYIFIRNLPNILSSSIRTDLLAVNSTTPLLISVPQSITQTKIKIAILKEFCPHPVLDLRLVGPEIYHDILNDTDLISSINDNVHMTQYGVPSSLLLGLYNVEVSLLHCGTVRNTFANSNKSCVIESHWNHIINVGSQSSNATTISSTGYWPRNANLVKAGLQNVMNLEIQLNKMIISSWMLTERRIGQYTTT